MSIILQFSDSVALSVVHLSPLGSQLSFSNTTRIENVADWETIAKRYRALWRDSTEGPARSESEDVASTVSEMAGAAAPTPNQA